MSEKPPLPRERRRTTKGLRSLPVLVRDLVALLKRLVIDEIALFKLELVAKAKAAGIGIGLFVTAALLAFFALAVLVATAVLGFTLVLPAWLAALIVGFALLLLAGILVLVGVRAVKQAVPPVPEDTRANLSADLHALKGERP